MEVIRLIKEFKYTEKYVSIMTSKLVCDICKRKVMIRSEVSNGVFACLQCFDDINPQGIADMKIPEKPAIVYLWEQKLSLMGTYPDGKSRYMITIPKKKREDFFLDGLYDVKFILKIKEKKIES